MSDFFHSGRVSTYPNLVYSTTPPALGSFFAVFIDSVKEANKRDDYFFRLVNHSLACAACLEKGKARECTHNLRFIPPWKSLLRYAFGLRPCGHY